MQLTVSLILLTIYGILGDFSEDALERQDKYRKKQRFPDQELDQPHSAQCEAYAKVLMQFKTKSSQILAGKGKLKHDGYAWYKEKERFDLMSPRLREETDPFTAMIGKASKALEICILFLWPSTMRIIRRYSALLF